MYISLTDVFSVILCILGSILLVALIVLVFRMMNTLKKVDDAIDDYNEKSQKLNGVFEIIDTATDTISLVSDKIVGGVMTGITNLFNKRKKKEDDEDE